MIKDGGGLILEGDVRESLEVLLIQHPLLHRVGVVKPALQVIRHVLVFILMKGSLLSILLPVSLLILLHDHIVIVEAREHPRFHASINGALSWGNRQRISAAGVFIAPYQWWLGLAIHTVSQILIHIRLSIFILMRQLLLLLPLLPLFIFELLKCGLK
jgi:hypothetical protein